MEEKELEGKVVIGVLVDREVPTYHKEYEKLRARIRLEDNAI